MNEADIRLEFQHLIRDLGFWDYHPPDDTPVATPKQIQEIIAIFKLQQVPNAFERLREVLKPPTWRRESISISRPDIYGLGPLQRCIVIECKALEPRKEVEPSLHPSDISEGQRTWLDAWKYQAGGFAFLGIGTVEGNPRDAWLIPWDVWVELEKKEAERAIEFRMPVSLYPEEFKLIWVTGNTKSRWQLPETHPLFQLSIPETSPNLVDWKKQYSLRFSKKESGNAA